MYSKYQINSSLYLHTKLSSLKFGKSNWTFHKDCKIINTGEKEEEKKFLLVTTHKRDHKVDVVMEHKKSQKDIFKLTATLSHGQRIQVGKHTFSEQGTSISGFQFFKSARKGKQFRGHGCLS